MEKICILTGLPKSESPVKEMCLNCIGLSYDKDTDSFVCKNENVMAIGFEKVKEAAKGFGFDVETLTLKPMTLKNPQKKCNHYSPDMERINNVITETFGLTNEN